MLGVVNGNVYSRLRYAKHCADIFLAILHSIVHYSNINNVLTRQFCGVMRLALRKSTVDFLILFIFDVSRPSQMFSSNASSVAVTTRMCGFLPYL